MRKLVTHPKMGSTDGSSNSQDSSLALTHLRKLFAEFRQPPPNIQQSELEYKLYSMLPLFCKVSVVLLCFCFILFLQTFGAAPAGDMTEKFGDILQFCSHVSRLMVSEIRRRASNQSTGKKTTMDC